MEQTQSFLDAFGDKHQFTAISLDGKTEAVYGAYDKRKEALIRLNASSGIFFTVHEMAVGTKRTKEKFRKPEPFG